MNTIIKDSRQRPIAHIRENGNVTSIYDKGGAILLGTFNKACNSTYTAQGKLVGRGNLLQTLIKPY